jgi:uncharacterized protein (DUF1778 family)
MNQRRTAQINVRMTPDEAKMLQSISAHEERTQSDTLRLLLRRAFADLLALQNKHDEPRSALTGSKRSR